MAFATLQEVQIASTEMLADFDRYCRENGITYFISYGTALGAVRHQGFIPWDDDVDVDMHVDDIKKLLSKWETNGDKETYFLQTKKTDRNVPWTFIRLRKNNTSSLDEKFKHVPLHWGLPIDIFPVYNYPDSKLWAKLMRAFFFIAKRSSAIPFYHYHFPKAIHKCSTGICVLSLKAMKAISDRSRGSKRLMYSGSMSMGVIQREVYYPPRLLKFGDLQLSGMNQVEKYLEQQYGDYMTPPPEDQRSTHGSLVDLTKDYTEYI